MVELHVVWVVGVCMLEAAIGVPRLGAVAEVEAAVWLAESIAKLRSRGVLRPWSFVSYRLSLLPP
jgi:hypothetical protein